MGSYANFENLTTMAMPSEVKNGVNYPLTRQGSIYSMTFDELQSMGSLGRDIGSLNMEELLKNLWTAEEIQSNSTINGGSSSCNAPCGPCPIGNLQRQGSLTLPRTISQKTVDDVWKELFKENGGGGFRELGFSNNTFQREPTLGEITLEEFLSKAGVVIEEIPPFEKLSNNGGFNQGSNKPIENPNNGSFSGGFGQPNNGFTIDFQQPSPNKVYNNEFSFNLELNGNRAMSPPKPPPHPRTETRLNPLYPEAKTLPFASPQPPRSRVISSAVGGVNGGLFNSPAAAEMAAISRVTNSPRVVNGCLLNSPAAADMAAISGVTNSPHAVNHNHGLMNVSSVTNSVANSPRAVSHNGMMNIASSVVTNPVRVPNSPRAVGPMNITGLHNVKTIVPRGSPRNHRETTSKNNLDSQTLSTSPYAYNEGGQGRRSSSNLDKQVERRRRRMLKNRESAARSRARKQEYITELEEEIAKLKENNRKLKEKQVELMNIEINQETDSGKVKQRRLRRTVTGQW